MKHLNKTIAAVLAISALLALSGCSEDISAASPTTTAKQTVTAKQEEQVYAVNSDEPITETSGTGTVTEATEVIVSERQINSNSSSKGIELEKYMSGYGFKFLSILRDKGSTEGTLNYGITFSNDVDTQISIHCCQETDKSIVLGVTKKQYDSVYRLTIFSSDSDEMFSTEYKGILINSEFKNILDKILEERVNRIDNNNCPFAGLGYSHIAKIGLDAFPDHGD